MKRIERPDDAHAFGVAGERVAARHLRGLGYRILARSFATDRGEIDIVAREGRWLVFAEVKTRSSERFAEPIRAVDLRKRRRIALAAIAYLRRLGGRPTPFRFDVIEVVWPSGEDPVFRVHRDAFEMPEPYIF